jgi:hypothetical protein
MEYKTYFSSSLNKKICGADSAMDLKEGKKVVPKKEENMKRGKNVHYRGGDSNLKLRSQTKTGSESVSST